MTQLLLLNRLKEVTDLGLIQQIIEQEAQWALSRSPEKHV